MIAPDTSVVIAALVSWHEAHDEAEAALANAPVVLVAGVGVETAAVLSRMPAGERISATVVLEALRRRFNDGWISMTGDQTRSALATAIDAGVSGGALYDAVIAATARHHGATLLSGDRRARRTYEAMGVDFVDVRF